METPDTNGPTGADSASVREAASAAVAPDPVTADLLARHSAGEKLTQPEYGKVGAWKARLKAIWNGTGKNGPAVGPDQPEAVPGHAPVVAPLAPAEAPDGGLAPVPIDAALARRTTAVVLTRCESIAVRYVGNAARKVGAKSEDVARLERAAALSKDDKALMVDLAPDVCTSMGLNPRHFPVAVFFGTFGAWATDLWLAVEEIKASASKKPEEPEEKKLAK